MSNKAVRTVLTILMDVLVVLAIAITLRLIVAFFGALADQGWGEAVIAITNPIVLPLGIKDITTPYDGIFDANAGVTVLLMLVAEWVLSLVRSRA